MTRVECLVIGSGAGGAVTALELAAAGRQVLVLEEGARVDASQRGLPPPEAMARFYRRRGMTPILGRVPLGWVEGCVVGGSTEVNSGFWHRTPADVLARWGTDFGLVDASPASLVEHFERAEQALHVGPRKAGWPASTKVFAKGAEQLGWSYQEVPRTASACVGANACASVCPTGAKRGMSTSLLPEAEAQGARVLAGARVERLLRQRGRVTGAVVSLTHPDQRRERVRIEAEHVFVCAGPTQTPALLRRSGFRRHVGDTLKLHPMLKVVARFNQRIDAERDVLPLVQVKEFWPEVSLGGAFFTPGHLGMLLSEDWPRLGGLWSQREHLGAWYVGVRGNGLGRVRASLLGGDAVLRYEVSDDDVRGLSQGFARLCQLLLAAGAEEVCASAWGIDAVRTEAQALRWLEEPLPRAALGLSTVHAFSSCPAGERADRCAVDSFGRLRDVDNVVVSDASILPDSPGVNPQGSVMAFARRNALAFLARNR